MNQYPPKFAPVAPPHILEELLTADPRHLFGSYHLWLAHMTVERKVSFQALLKRFNEHSIMQLTIIMDNSIVELGASQSCEMVAEATDIASYLGQHQVIPVLPDVMGDGIETIKLVQSEIARWRRSIHHPVGFMLVAQGATLNDFKNLVHHFFVTHKADYPDVTWVGIPRKIQQLTGTRIPALEYLKMIAPHVNIHLLGFSDSIEDDIYCTRSGGVVGIDSAVPLRYDHPLLPTTLPKQIGTRGTWMDDGQLCKQNKDNVRNIRKWIREFEVY